MPKGDFIEMEGEVVEVLRNATFKVKLPNDHIITTYLSGKVRKSLIKILNGDMVRVEISPYDLTKGRITYRLKR